MCTNGGDWRTGVALFSYCSSVVLCVCSTVYQTKPYNADGRTHLQIDIVYMAGRRLVIAIVAYSDRYRQGVCAYQSDEQ